MRKIILLTLLFTIFPTSMFGYTRTINLNIGDEETLNPAEDVGFSQRNIYDMYYVGSNEDACDIQVKRYENSFFTYSLLGGWEKRFGYIIKLKAKKPGTYHLRVDMTAVVGRLSDLKNYKDATIYYTINVIEVESITFPTSELTLVKGDSYLMEPLPYPKEARTTYTWASSNTNVATVTDDGTITALKRGNATITCTTDNNKQATCSVTVENIKVKNIEFANSPYTILNSEKIQLSPTITPTNADDQRVYYTSSDPSVAKVNSNNGIVEGVSLGEVTITCSAKDGSGVKGTCIVKVIPQKVTEIVIEPASCYFEVGESLSLYSSVKPEEAYNKQLEWSSSNTSVATVSAEGVVLGVKEGWATITAKAKDGSGITATCDVHVLEEGTVFLDNLYYRVDESSHTAELIGAEKEAGYDITVPETINCKKGTFAVKSIGNNAFQQYRYINSIIIPNSVETIGAMAFWGSGVSSVTIGSGVKKIGGFAFDTGNLPNVSSPSSVYITDLKAWCNIEFNGNKLFKGGGTLYLNGKEVKGELRIPDGVTEIRNSAFERYQKITSVIIPNSVTSIGAYAFYQCPITSITFGENVRTIGESAFEYCKLNTLSIPNNVLEIGRSAFKNNRNLTSLTLPQNIESIEREAFATCNSLSSLTIPEKVTSIGNSAFYGCTNLTTLTIPNSVKTIGYEAFEGSKLQSLIIPNGVTEIGASAFSSCKALTEITIPNSLISIGYSAFSGCNNLVTVNSYLKIPFSIDNNVFSNVYDKVTLYVPFGTKAKYQEADGWNKIENIAEMEASEKGDMTGDGIVNVTDLVALVDILMSDMDDASADLNGDGVVNITDLVILIEMVMSSEPSNAR